MFWLCTRRLGNISCIHPHFRAFATAQDVLVGSNGRINGLKYSINSFQGPDSLSPNEYRGFLGDEPVSIHVVANWEVANGWRRLSAMCGSKYLLEPKLVHEVGSGDILVFTRRVDCSLEQWCHDNKPLVDSDKFIIPRLRVIYRDIAEALLQVMERTGKCHGNVTPHSVKVINGNAFLSCPAANWIGMSLSGQMDASMFKLLLDAAHPEKTAEASEEVTYFMKALDSTDYSTLSFLIGHHPIFRTLEGKMELWLLLSRLTLEFKGKERELEPSYTKLCQHWDEEYLNVTPPDWGKELSKSPSLFGRPNSGHPIMLLVRGRNAAEHKIIANGEVKFIKVLSKAWNGYLSMLLAVARKYYDSKFRQRWSDISWKPNVQRVKTYPIWRQNDVGVSPNYRPFPFLSFRHLRMVTFARLQKEFEECSRDVERSGIKVSLKSDDSLARLIGTIPGPIGTPYEGGTFQIDIQVPDEYPFVPPEMRFTTKVWHPNISSQNGEICLGILKNEWIPGRTLKTALLSVRALLSAPQPYFPQDAVVAQQYLDDYQTFVGTARYWTETFAKRVSLD